MSNQFLYIFKENLESHLEILTAASGTITPRLMTVADYPAALASDLALVGEAANLDFAILIAKETYFNTDTRLLLIEKTLAHGVLAEPMFIVASVLFKEEEMREIIGRHDNFLLITMAENGPETARRAYLSGVIQKGLSDFENNKRAVTHLRESFLAFIQSEKHREEKTEIERINDELIMENKIDTLTRILNRKGIMIEYQIAQSRTRREQRYLESEKFKDHLGHLSCMMTDIDDFKLVNDSYGHLVGDQVLQKIAMVLNDKTIFRLEDICGRYGGEEFLVIFPNTASSHAKIPAERYRDLVERTPFYTEEGVEFHVTVSVGIAELPYTVNDPDGSMQDRADLEVLIHRADMAMYEAKKRGKNMVVLYEEMT